VTTAPLLAAVVGALGLSAGAPAPPRPALTASPSRIVLAGTATANVRVSAPRGAQIVDVSLAPYVLDLRGRPRLAGPTRAPSWVLARPARLRLRGKGAVVTLLSRPPRGAAPGDRPFALVLTTAPAHRRGVDVRLRVGVFVLARVPGKVVRKLVIGPLRVRRAGGRPMLDLAIRNSGNVAERIAAGRLVLEVATHGRVVARLRPSARELLPHSRALVGAAFRGRLRGPATVQVRLGAFSHLYRIQL
jgi:hypothetical protein